MLAQHTLFRGLFGIERERGEKRKTTEPKFHEVDKKLFAVDYPGSDGLEDHARAFSNCGPMNNLVVLLVHFAGDASRTICREIANVYSAAASGVNSSDIIICVNKCGLFLSDYIREDLEHQEDDSVGYLKKSYADKLNSYFKEKEMRCSVDRESILFTDWKDGDREDMAGLGISGVDAVRERIKEYLVGHHIFKPSEDEKLDNCLTPSPRPS